MQRKKIAETRKKEANKEIFCYTEEPPKKGEVHVVP